MTIVYSGGRLPHLSTATLHAHMAELVESNHHRPLELQVEITDAVAQTIAAMWHSPGRPESTLLSTMGQVSDTMTMGDFATSSEYESADAMDKVCLDYLLTYILRKQADYHDREN